MNEAPTQEQVEQALQVIAQVLQAQNVSLPQHQQYQAALQIIVARVRDVPVAPPAISTNGEHALEPVDG